MKPVRNAMLYRQKGASLAVALLMLVAVLILSGSAANNALQGDKAARNERDRQVAFQAAEAALVDAEQDIESGSRSILFAKDSAEGFYEGCAGAGPHLGLCLPAMEGQPPAWLLADFAGEAAQARTVSYGQFTGAVFQAGKGTLPARPPRYIIELLPYTRAGEDAGSTGRSYFYRITAAGFGMRPETLVVLQTYFRKEGP